MSRSLLNEAGRWTISKCEYFFAILAERRHWLLAGTIAALLVSLMITFPRVSFFTGKDPQIVNFWPYIEEQARHPLSNDLSFYAVSPTLHQNKLAFRLTLPILARVFHLGQTGLIVLQFVLGVLLLIAVGKIMYELYGDRIVAIATVFGVSSLYAGKAAFLELGGVGDAVAFAFLTFAAALRTPPLIFGAVLAAAFSDERAVIAAPLVALYWAVKDADGPKRIAWFTPRPLAVGGALLSYGSLRLYLGYRYGLRAEPAPLSMIIGILTSNLAVMQWEIPRALAGLWVWVIAAAVLLWRSGSRLVTLLAALNAGAVVALAMLVDFQRSAAYLLPLLFVAWAALARLNLSTRNARDIAIVSFVVSLLIPVNSYFAPTTRYADANLFPVEMVRLVRFLEK